MFSLAQSVGSDPVVRRQLSVLHGVVAVEIATHLGVSLWCVVVEEGYGPVCDWRVDLDEVYWVLLDVYDN